MELRYPLLFIVLIIITIVYLIKSKNQKTAYKSGSKIANTNFIKNTDYYKIQLKKYLIIKKIISVCCITSIFASILLLARPNKLTINNPKEYNRDIFLCLDVSSSVDELNKELVNNLKDTVKSLKNERFGISIFNASSVTLVPLTDDYEYVVDALDQIEKSINANNSLYSNSLDDDYFYTRNYIISGTQENADTRGSSLIGDGLASCVYNFSNLDEERTRIIIFSTDNDLAGTPIVSLNKAAEISKNKKIKVFGIGPSLITDKNKSEFKEAVEKTAGKYYDQDNSNVKSIVQDIEKTSKSLLNKQSEATKNDIPELPFIVLLLSSSTLLILNKKVII